MDVSLKRGGVGLNGSRKKCVTWGKINKKEMGEKESKRREQRARWWGFKR